MNELTTEQADQIIMLEYRIQSLRTTKEHKKSKILQLDNDIVNIDIELRKLRIELASIRPEEPKPHKETDEEKIARLEKEIEAIRNKTT